MRQLAGHCGQWQASAVKSVCGNSSCPNISAQLQWGRCTHPTQSDQHWRGWLADMASELRGLVACHLRSSISNSAPGRAVYKYVLFPKLCEFTHSVVNALFVSKISFVVNVLFYTWYSKCRTIGHGTPLDLKSKIDRELNDYFYDGP